MKKTLLLTAAVLSTAIAAKANVSVTLNAGDLLDSTGSPMSDGSLVLLIAAGTDGTFSNSLSAGQYISGDDVILAALGSNNLLGSTEATTAAVTFTGLQGQAIELRWFPQITFASYSPGSPNTVEGDSFGNFAGATTGSPNGGDPWIIPADGSSGLSLNFITSSLNTSQSYGLGDAQPNTAGKASNTVLPVPEPSSVVLTGLGIAAAGFLARKRRS